MLTSRLVLALVAAIVATNPPPARAQNAAITIDVDGSLDHRPIAPEIYGVAFASQAQLSDLNVPLNRWGGNSATRYNWQLNAENHAADWYFESIADSSSVAGAEADSFIQSSKAGGAQPLMTIPTIGWAAKLGPNRSKLASFSIAKYGAQTGNDWQWFPDAGNGVWTNGQDVTGNDPNDANVAVDSAFQLGWMQHLTSRWGSASAGGLRYYLLDNEPSIWFSTHRDVHPVGPTMAEVRDRILDYAARVKDNDAGALVAAPEEWGWSGYFYSGYDQQYGSLHGWSSFPDRAANGNWDYLPWLLAQLSQQAQASGRRLLDVFSVHYYPQSGEFSDTVTTSMQQLRNRSTRSLWDPTYVDESWIDDEVYLVPRLRGWVNSYYPGTRIAITEYNWGAEGHINGATTQADILGIFGREGLDLATRWTTPDASTPTYKAIKMYRNYDGQGSTFGNTNVRASGPNPDTTSVFAALRSIDSTLTVMIVSKTLSGGTPAAINLSNFTAAAAAEVWQLTAENAIARLADVPVSGGHISLSLPAQSVTLLVVASDSSANHPPTARATASPNSGVAPLAVGFDGSGSTDSDGSVVAWAWSFGDGAVGTGASASHTYATAGSYTATLTVTDDRGASASTSLAITVSQGSVAPAAPTNLTASAANGTVTLRWVDHASNEGGFYVERAAKAKGALSWSRVGQVGANVTTFSQPAPHDVWLYRVQAFDQTQTTVSAYSNQAQVRVR